MVNVVLSVEPLTADFCSKVDPSNSEIEPLLPNGIVVAVLPAPTMDWVLIVMVIGDPKGALARGSATSTVSVGWLFN